MVSSNGISTLNLDLIHGPFLFASRPEPDLEFNDDDLDDQTATPEPPMPEPKKSGKKPFLWIGLLLLAALVGYIAMDPDGAMQFVEPYLDGGAETTAPPAPMPTAQAPAAPPASVIDKTPPMATEPTPTIPAPSSPIHAPTASTAMPTDSSPPIPAIPTAKPTPTVNKKTIAGPLFAEGQRVTVAPNPKHPKAPIALYGDPTAVKSSTTIPANSVLTVLDGDYQPSGWVYSVRTTDGRKGWLPERTLKLKR